ncbi:MAG: dienelactone hydrolase family protein [Opitutales bacterium]|nr:dienelactone hydrolase family protein [Opitutales bacterium]
MATLDALLDDVISRYRIDEKRIYVTGLSMGGSGAWHLATAYPERFAAIAPIGGGGIPEKAASIAHLPIWVFYGELDTPTRIERIDAIVDALREVGSRIKVTSYPDRRHDAWSVTYDGSRLYEWFLEHTRSDPPPAEGR